MYGQTNCDQRLQDENRRLQQELDDQRYERERQQEQEQRERQQAREDRRREAREAMCHASTWEEAFGKGLILYAQEARQEERDNAHIRIAIAEDPDKANNPLWEPTYYFANMPEKVRQAQTIYREEMQAVEEQIRQLRERALLTVADRVESEVGGEIEFLVEGLREDNPECLTNW